MNTIRSRVMMALLIVACLLLPGASAECDCEDGEFEFDLDGLFCGDDDHDCGGGCHDDDCGGFVFDFWFDD